MKLDTGETSIAGQVNVVDPAADFAVTTVSPDEVDILGGDLLTVTGSGFPTTVGEITVELADGTACTTQSLTLTTITCILDPPISGEGPEDVIVKAYDEERIPG